VAAITHPDLGSAIDRMYEAAAYPELWPDALGSFANALGGFGGTIVGFSADEKLISYVSPESVEIAAAYARGGWADHNFRIQLGAPLIRAGRQFVHERMLSDRRGIDRQRMQNEFLNEFRLRSFVGFEFVPGEIGGCVERGTAEIEDWEISELERASHHLKRIGAVASARGAMLAQGIETGLDHLRAGAILLDRRGRIVGMNARAASIRDRVFQIQSGQLSPRDTEMESAFGRMLQGVSAAGHAHEIGSDAAVRLRCSDGSSFLARAAPLVGPAIDIFLRARILLLLTPLQAAGFESTGRLRDVFGLTRAEARLAGCLAAGDDLASAALRLGVSQGTLRGALKAIFRKTGAKRQAELVGLLTRIDI
jgi:DNA-binding CsgD family transcriptional regulator